MPETNHPEHECKKTIMAVHDAMDVLHGKWKISIVAALSFGNKRYSELLREVNGVSGKMLSRELKDMELNQLIKRTVLDKKPITVEYELTEYGENLKSVIDNLASWGIAHRKKIIGK